MDRLLEDTLLEEIRQENLKVYRSSPQRLREDVGQESQISQDYRGRLIYELLQNADDAMDASSGDARICFELTEDALWVANSGRPLDHADIRGLCGISASSKRVRGKRRASIGHKGMGFKSVLEISDAPEVYSTSLSFRFSPQEALTAIQPLIQEGLVDPIRRAPICRFPWPIEKKPQLWSRLLDRGFRTAFRFPLRLKEVNDQRGRLQEALQTLPVSSLLFLKRLKVVEIGFNEEERSIRWGVERKQHGPKGVIPVDSLTESGVYTVQLAGADGTKDSFMLAHDAEIPIGTNRGGLNEFAWESVELTEAAVACRIEDGKATELPASWRKLHVFLPSGESCPYELLISGAFNSNLSRQEIKVDSATEDYNRYLLQRIAGLFRDQLLPSLMHGGTSTEGVLRLLRRPLDSGKNSVNGATKAVYEAFCDALRDFSFVPTESGRTIPISSCVVPPIVSDTTVGKAFRDVLPVDAAHDTLLFPASQFCGGELAPVIVDHGARVLTVTEAAMHLSEADPRRAMLREHPSGGLYIDPVLSVLEGLWEGLAYDQRQELTQVVRQLPLFPTVEAKGGVVRIKTAELQCFYPPRSLKGEVGLSGLCFLMQDLCWGALSPAERNQLLAKEMPIWQSLFDLREFKFPDVMRASVLPALDLDSASDNQRRAKLRTFDTLAAICQLAGRMPDASKPLPYERLGPNRALFNLSRLDVPCRGASSDDAITWVPAYRVYLGEDWVGEASFERVCKAIAAGGGGAPKIDFLVSPQRFAELLDNFRHLELATTDEAQDVGEDEVRIDEDEESALDTDDQGRWLEFFRWLGVNQLLRPVHFHDVEDRASGWLKTRSLHRPEGWAFSAIPQEKWKGFLASIAKETITAVTENPGAAPYFYRLHDLEHIVLLLDAAATDVSAGIGRAMYEHFARNWPLLEPFTQLDIAIVEGEPQRRAKPPRAREDEILELEDSNFWLYRLRHASVCPTGHGPRQPAEVWYPTQEVLRRFGRRVRDGVACLLPTIDLPTPLLKGRARGLIQAIGIREELSSSSFTEADALVVLNRLRDLYRERVERGDDLRQELREVIRPAYRHVLELLAGRPPSDDTRGVLRDAPLLAQDGQGHLAFRAARDVFYMERRDTRDRLQADVAIWTFVLEAYQAGRTPLMELCSCRGLEDSVKWRPRIGDPAFAGTDNAHWRARLKELAPYILARVGADRVEETQARRDALRLRELVVDVEPVTDIQLGCELDGHQLPTKAIAREAFVQLDPVTGKVVSFVRWGETLWPPSEDDAEALATVFGEVLGTGYFESFLALIRAPSDAKRHSLLKRAGAPTDIEERRLMLFEGFDVNDSAVESQTEVKEEPKSASQPRDKEEVAKHPQLGPLNSEQLKQVPLFSPDQIAVNGMPVTLYGTPTPGHDNGARTQRNSAPATDGADAESNATGYGGHTDMDELNTLGMTITIAYELARLRKSGHVDPQAFIPGSPNLQTNTLVFDVSTPAKIARARASSPNFDKVFSRLINDFGISPEWPGFDVLTLKSASGDEIDRVIELKSSGVSARIQEMSWNEWKSARSNTLRHNFYLYLVGNLRADLEGAVPFVRTIRDPFEQLLAETQVSQRTERKVQLAVHLFREAEHLDLTVLNEQHTHSNASDEQPDVLGERASSAEFVTP